MATPRIGAPGQGLNLMGQASRGNLVCLAAGQTQIIPAGQWLIELGAYSFIQFLDPVSGLWRISDSRQQGFDYVQSDGTNVRIANLTGTPVGAVVTTAGSGYTTAPTVTPSSGNSQWQAIVGGALNSSVTITAAGSNFTYAPILYISPPPAGGIQATATCTISAGAINAVTVTNQGAGYTQVPTITVVRDPRDTTGGGATLTPALTGAGTITAVVCTNPGTPITSVPTLTFGSGSAAATAIMCFTTTGYTVGAGGVAYGNAQPFGIFTIGGVTAGSSVLVNPKIQTGIFQPRQAVYNGTSTAGGAIQTGGLSSDTGLFQAVPLGLVIAGGTALATTVGQVTMTVGGVTDTSLIQPF